MICPECKEEIDELVNIQSGWNTYKMWISEGDKTPTYEEVDFEGDDNVIEWRCPECDECLFTSEDEAIDFLKNKDELQEIVNEKIKKIKEEKEEKNGK